MQISARADYALRALCVLATAEEGLVVKAAQIAEAQAIPRTFLDQILTDLGVRRMRVLSGSSYRMQALSGFGLEVVEYVHTH